MKFVCSSLTLSFLLFAFVTNLSPSFTYNNGFPILNTAFEPIHPYGSYYIIPTFFGVRSGRLKLEKTGDSKCPVTILEEDFNNTHYLPVKFTKLVDTEFDEIVTGTPIEIEFTRNKPDCVESTKWLIFIDNVINKFCVGIGGPENYPGMQIVNGTFNIQRYGSSYNFVFCVDGSSAFCSDIGFYNNGEGGGRLILTDQKISAFVFSETYSYEDGNIRSVA
ncbi:kunitz-type trypsin inhibitor-like 2 protein [Trifolium pratense]|uniref:kunitz-type trypsin inhibitor-like 2 protein n=1 Tax=Trifolium pratense TaxID=57577 RepID=UPI001E69019A|nr:kunitz-type trypsin inhibitor-like 2 protein [Trifolium pratense]